MKHFNVHNNKTKLFCCIIQYNSHVSSLRPGPQGYDDKFKHVKESFKIWKHSSIESLNSDHIDCAALIFY